MPKINILTEEVAQLIAAGEVVERPGSVVKEMVENSIDAGATAVTVEIKNGGNTFLRVSDNGCGIAREDCPAAFMPHATSKIRTGEDLDRIATLGFRGEALASVASVARVELLTKTADEEIGTRMLIEGGEIIDLDDAGCPDGTVITVRDLFFNTPARRKFLKKDMTEAANISQIMERCALSHPEISFTLRKETGDVLYTAGDGNLTNAVASVLGREVAEGMKPVDYCVGAVTVKGLTSLPISSRPNRNLQIFFLNGRFIRSKTFAAALEQAYKDCIMVGKFPACVLNVSVPCDAVDVNVHPAKLEVRFADEQAMFRAVYYAVKTALDSVNEAPQAQINLSKGRESVTRPAEFVDEKPKQTPLFSNQKGGFYTVDLSKGNASPFRTTPTPTYSPLPTEKLPFAAEEGPRERPLTVAAKTEYAVSTKQPTPPAPAPVMPTPDPVPDRPVYRFVGEAFDTYILAECGSSLYFVDKHALHERILFEKLKAGTEIFSQPLLTPLPVTLTKEEYVALLDDLDFLAKAGFDLADFGEGTVLVRAMPMYYETSDVEDSLTEIAGKLIHDKFASSTDRVDWLFRNVACRAAIKAGAKSSPEELMKLLASIDDIHYCPHGRPVTLEMTKQKLEKEFHRQ